MVNIAKVGLGYTQVNKQNKINLLLVRVHLVKGVQKPPGA